MTFQNAFQAGFCGRFQGRFQAGFLGRFQGRFQAGFQEGCQMGLHMAVQGREKVS